MQTAPSIQGLAPVDGGGHTRHRPESTLLYQIVERHYPRFLETLGATGRSLPRHVQREFEDCLKCSRLGHGFLRVRCEGCHAEKLMAFSCKRRGFCPSCGARRMTESAALLVDRVLPQVPIRQWVLSMPFALRYLFARDPQAMGAALGVAYRTIAAFQAAIEDPEVIEKILRHLGLEEGERPAGEALPRGPPQSLGLFE